MDTKKKGFNSKLIHAGGIDNMHGSPVTPIYQTSTFYFDNADQGAARFAGEEDGYIYTRLKNPTILDLENTVAELENGYGGIATASGMGAVNVIYFGLLKQGDHVVSTAAIYGPSRGVMENYYANFGISATYVDSTDLDAVQQAIQPNTALLFLETPTNPTLDITDIKAIAELAKKQDILVAVDNTFCSPYLQRPLDLGADVVFHSMTKFINGHADIVAGIVVTKTKALYKRLHGVMVNLGVNMDPHQAFLTRRGLKTLSIRIEQAQKNAIQIANYLESHPLIESIRYPGLVSHPQYELAKAQMDGPGSMMSFELKGGLVAGKKLMDSVEMAILAVSLGGIETLIQHPASMTHSKVPAASRLEAGITDGLVRLSVGIENVEDLIADLAQALEKVGELISEMA